MPEEVSFLKVHSQDIFHWGRVQDSGAALSPLASSFFSWVLQNFYFSNVEISIVSREAGWGVLRVKDIRSLIQTEPKKWLLNIN